MMQSLRLDKLEKPRPRRLVAAAKCVFPWVLLAVMSAAFSACAIAPIIPRPGIGVDQFSARTQDGWDLSLFRYSPQKLDPKKKPVILCHGLSFNALFWDPNNSTSLARYLAEDGYDVWTVSLRGAGKSTKPGLSVIRNLIKTQVLDLPHAIFQASFDFNKIDWTLDDYASYDVPAVIDLVIRETKAESVHWIGHSMGGMLMYVYLARPESAGKVHSFVALSAPATFPHPLEGLMEAFTFNKDIMKIFNLAISNRLGAFVGSATGGLLETPTDTLFYNRHNMDPQTIRDIFMYAAEDIAPGVLDQLVISVKQGAFVSAGGKTTYTDAMKEITAPTYFLVGKLDNIALPESVRFAYNQVSSKDKVFEMVSVANGFSADYGHNDIVLGKNAPREIYTRIKNWLDRHP